MSSRIRSLSFALFLILIVFACSVAAQDTPATPSATPAQKPEIKKVAPVYTNPSSGRQMYDAYCASCHGQGGKGNGPAAPALKVQPTDLTQLAAKNGGRFPDAHVMQVIRGDSMNPAHGSKDMPVWGPIFSQMSQHSEGVEQLRIRNLARYIGLMQQK
jgi:mono/diheme cytochrome c family protein